MKRSEFYSMALRNIGVMGVVQRATSMKSGAPRMKLTSKYLSHPVHARRGTSDLAVFDQIFVEREYSCLDHLKGARTIMDLGANCGFSSAYFLSQCPDARVIAVEPDPDNFSALSDNTRSFGARIMPLNGAVWSECTTLSFAQETEAKGLEWGRQTREVTDDGGTRMPAWDMPTLMAMAGFEDVDILKIDVEGAEAKIFAAPDLSWLDRVRNIVIELHGPECERIFHAAISGRDFAMSRSSELTVCTSRQAASLGVAPGT